MTAADELVWVATVRRGITYHRITPPHTGCGRSMRHGAAITLTFATQELAGEPCPRCTAAGSPEGCGPADGTARAGAPIQPAHRRPPSPVSG